MPTTDNLERVEPEHMLDAIYGWVAFHTGQTVQKHGSAWTLLPPERERILGPWGNPRTFPAVKVSLRSIGTANYVFAEGGRDIVTSVSLDDRELRVWRGQHVERFTLAEEVAS